MRKRIFWKICLAILGTGCFLFVGCSKLTTENYDQLHIGMAYDEVILLLGESDACSGALGLKSCTWGDVDKHIKASFAGDKVVFFSSQGL